jgi:2-hydroxychromene-2-carboxylate isomerase
MRITRNIALLAFFLSFVVGMLLMHLLAHKLQPPQVPIAKDSSSALPERPKAKPGAVRVELFVMSQCPYGVQAVNGIKPAIDKLGEEVDLSIDYIGQGSSPASLSSMHGPKEVAGDIVQLCAATIAPTQYLDFIVCQNRNYQNVDSNWETCASESGIASERLRSCLRGDQGKKLLAASFERSQTRGATGSPTIYISGALYQGGRRSSDYLKAICNAASARPAPCQQLPEPKPVNVWVLSDKRCPDCDTSRISEGLKTKISSAVIKPLDYSEPEGRKLYDQIKPGNLPVIVFDRTLDDDEDAKSELESGLKSSGSYRYLSAGGEYNPVCMSDKGCDKPECKNTLACRKQTPNRLEVFVMSQCPYGVKALDAMSEVLKNFGDKLEFVVHFIGDGDGSSGLKSMHGQGEVDEDLRELCAIKHYAKNRGFMDYIWCRNKDIRSGEWKKCTGGSTGIDSRVIETCAGGDEGKKWLEQEFKLASSLGIGGSPTWLVNGRFKFSGIDAEAIRKNVCEHNQGLKGCENKLSGSSGPPVQGGCGK